MSEVATETKFRKFHLEKRKLRSKMQLTNHDARIWQPTRIELSTVPVLFLDTIFFLGVSSSAVASCCGCR